MDANRANGYEQDYLPAFWQYLYMLMCFLGFTSGLLLTFKYSQCLMEKFQVLAF